MGECHALCHGSAGASAYPSSLGVDGASFRASFRPFPALSSPEKMAIQAAAILLISLPAFPFMAYGCRGIWNSADSRAADMAEMKEQFAENEKMLEAQQTEAVPIPEEKGAESRPALDHVACIGDSVMLGSAWH